MQRFNFLAKNFEPPLVCYAFVQMLQTHQLLLMLLHATIREGRGTVAQLVEHPSKGPAGLVQLC